MKIPRFSNAIGNLDEDIVEAAAECKKKKQNLWLKWSSIAACFAVLVVAGALVLPSLLGGEPTPGGANNRYKDINIMAGETAIVWPWEYQTVFEKYTEVTIDGKVAMYVTVDGYLWTNAFNYQYLFNIGEDAAGKIIKYAKENSTEAEYEPYQNTIVGKITEITDEYILLDDSILCTNPDDGITYKILLNDLRISRYAESGAIRVGENVQITYEGEIDESNTIDSAISASDVVISGGDVLIPE